MLKLDFTCAVILSEAKDIKGKRDVILQNGLDFDWESKKWQIRMAHRVENSAFRTFRVELTR